MMLLMKKRRRRIITFAAAKASSDLRRVSFSVLGFWSVETAIVKERVRHLAEEEEKQLRRVSPAIPEAAISE